jgi:hypothetical protein
MDAIEKYDGITASYHPEGYMTRNPEITEIIKKRGYDGIVQSMYGDEAVVFNANQIKSATDNNGDFSLTKNNIYENQMITKFKIFETIKNLPDTFYKWFGKSKVVDINGEPLIVYHGSSEIFSEFDPKTFGKHATAEGFGFYFTDSKNVASRYIDNGKLYEVYLRICKPLNYTKKTITRTNLVKFIDLE